jgi:hypothetical protein
MNEWMTIRVALLPYIPVTAVMRQHASVRLHQEKHDAQKLVHMPIMHARQCI